jgi:hypothetical protein
MVVLVASRASVDRVVTAALVLMVLLELVKLVAMAVMVL